MTLNKNKTLEPQKYLKKTTISTLTDNTLNLNDSNIKEILKQRAVDLAKEIDYSDDESGTIDIVEFLLNNEVYAFDSSYVNQVIKLKDLTIIPCTPNYVLGVTSIHEQIISIIDIRVFFQMKFSGITNLNKIVILEKNGISFGIAADEIIGIKKTQIDCIQKNIDTFDDIRKKYFFGLANNQTIILDAERILSDQDLIIK